MRQTPSKLMVCVQWCAEGINDDKQKTAFPGACDRHNRARIQLCSQAENDLEGGWIVSSWENPGDAAAEDAQPGIFIFTSTNYVFMYVNAAEPRPGYDAEAGMTDAEKMAAYDSLTANAGGYEIDGSKFTTYAYVAKDTNYMGGFPENGVEHEFVRDGDALTITGTSGPNPFKVVLERVEGEDGPWETQ